MNTTVKVNMTTSMPMKMMFMMQFTVNMFRQRSRVRIVT